MLTKPSNSSRSLLLGGFLLLRLLLGTATADELVAATDGLPLLTPVYVYPTVGMTAGGRSHLSREVIDQLPRGNGSINELLGVLPDVQFSEGDNSSIRGGEILPPDVSISGGKVFQNRFSVNGISIDSLLDPKADDPNDADDVPGHPQALFLDASLVEAVTLFDSNIPARYGGFTGGVVDVALRDPGEVFSGRIDYRTTNDQWTRFHLSDQDRYDFSNSPSASFQPRFRKDAAGVSFDLPVNAGFRLLAAYRLLRSEIPLQLFDQTESQSRENHNLLLRGVLELGQRRRLESTLIYAPYQATYFIPDARDSRFIIDGGGLQLQELYRQSLPQGDAALRLSWTQHENSRQAPQNWRLWAATDSRDWGRLVDSSYSRQGGFGALEKTQNSIEAAADFNWSLAESADFGHDLAAGLGLELVSGTYRRTQAATVYTDPRTTPDVICGADLFACIDGEQFFTLRKIYDPVKLTETLTSAYLYGEDQLTYHNLRLRPGIRLSYDDFLGNLNLAPRLMLSYDLFGDEQSLLTAGLNRYYGRSLLAFKLREAKRPPRSEFRTTSASVVTDWQPDPQSLYSVTRFSDLDTPYTDEAVIGLDQVLWNGQLSLKYILRRGQNEFSRSYGPEQSDGLRYYTMNNLGQSEHRILRLAWERSWTNQSLLISWVYQQSETSNEEYDSILDDEGEEPRIWYRGNIVYKSELPRRDYNRPHVVKLFYHVRLPHGFGFTNTTTFLGSYHSLENSGLNQEVPPALRRIDARTGAVEESLAVFQDVPRGNEFIFNWKLDWQRTIFSDRKLLLSLEVLNLFDRQVESGTDPGKYQLGRQFWAGLEYQF
jgi:hypothetical protein